MIRNFNFQIINIALKMLEQAITLSNNDGYIIDSLGWAHFMNKNYSDAENTYK